ncbi:phosphatase PAP2 family protein [Siphonobacter sp. SORGH_AS_1065]|uniref:phosphatase PAP2 family protein n=1 Tax=Siphonobacter sp. SORGH_AS_1065 TaxID=3041795 RepID=UPI002788D2BD|nr:phosphatase PAP2 family protein [Siphonobacter sp. SORGH_AS_1065]MDQ1087944.1 membrane-associated phospholipid phosphatase [Siphonobacter sp. SORGH_AS_1065]
MIRFLLSCWLVLFFFGTSLAQLDSTRRKPVWKPFIAPFSLMTAGLVTQGSISREIRRSVRQEFPNFQTKADNYLEFVPTLVPLSLGALGVKGKHAFKDQLVLMVLSQGVANSLSYGLKRIIQYPRPNGDDNLSFPSGHTSVAFTGAAVLSKEYGEQSVWYSIAGYGIATSVAGMRVLNDKHWVADVLFSAGLGIASTEAVYAVYPWIQRKIFKQNKLAVMPFYSGQTYGLAMVAPL